MPTLASMDSEARRALTEQLAERYETFKAQGLSLDMTRGKPCPAQLDLANPMLTLVDETRTKTAGGVDTRNYGNLGGTDEVLQLFADFLEVGTDEIIVHSNASLTLMHDTVANALLLGVPGGDKPWSQCGPIKFLCPCPGYDRHFSICEHFGIEMIVVDLTGEGPDMDQVESLVANDPSIKGIWCVPKYSNPTGETYSDAVVHRLAAMNCAAPDFRIFWDNAYTVHHLTDTPDELASILQACKDAANPDRVFLFGSTSKVTFAGSGVAMIGGSAANIAAVKKNMSIQAIGPDKINQQRHLLFFQDMHGVRAHMQQHATIIKPKFDAVDEVLERELRAYDVASWSRPTGGYFTSLDTPDGCAAEVCTMADAAGVKMTKAGATFPYGKDPRDRNIRISPSLPSLEEIRQAMELLAICVLRVALARD
ncbi:MAG: aminotransferase class I/II-fold pyridoxal phosphate-dependent enzyme [Verrucomicrobia bacterium]|nr:aminotransferase class I/II-fold pyridoxal phosphate-dependent enzyme [Verrucomicrobiota bacterium]MDA1085914.1 aminotransferase class I/II-fold pyridoxal phosphate-dependent enzyme [Verrucomicrobiota bacterium]